MSKTRRSRAAGCEQPMRMNPGQAVRGAPRMTAAAPRRIVAPAKPGRSAMTYAPVTRAFYDADSHIMELPDFLKAYADPGLRDEVPEVSYSASIVTDEEVAVIVGQGNRHSPEHVAAQIALGDKLIESSKEIQALGAFNAADRSTA